MGAIDSGGSCAFCERHVQDDEGPCDHLFLELDMSFGQAHGDAMDAWKDATDALGEAISVFLQQRNEGVKVELPKDAIDLAELVGEVDGVIGKDIEAYEGGDCLGPCTEVWFQYLSSLICEAEGVHMTEGEEAGGPGMTSVLMMFWATDHATAIDVVRRGLLADVEILAKATEGRLPITA